MHTTAELTGRQREIWSFLVDYVDRHGYPPTVREIGSAVGLASPSTVHAHLANLERAGLLRRDPTKPRALELVGRVKGAAKGAETVTAELPVAPLLVDSADTCTPIIPRGPMCTVDELCPASIWCTIASACWIGIA